MATAAFSEPIARPIGEDTCMLAITGDTIPVSEEHGATMRKLLEHARAVASGQAEGDVFTWFLATEYEWEMESACTWLVESTASELAPKEKEVLRLFLHRMPEVRQAITAGRQAARLRADSSPSPEWGDWLELVALPSWNDFTTRTAILLSQLGEPARNDSNYGIRVQDRAR
jgi:hypothetical protein